MPVSRWEDFVIFHMEPFLPGDRDEKHVGCVGQRRWCSCALCFDRV